MGNYQFSNSLQVYLHLGISTIVPTIIESGAIPGIT